MTDEPDPKTVAQNDYLEEWKAVRTSLDKFDNILVDLRKTGFSIVTGLITAEGLLRFLISNPIIFALVIIATMVFVSLWFWLDRYYYNLLWGAISRGRFLEEHKVPMKLNTFVGGFSSGYLKTIFPLLYVAMVGALLSLGVFTYVQESSQSASEINQLNVNMTGIQNKLNSTQIKQAIEVQSQINLINQGDYYGKFLPLLGVGTGFSCGIMAAAYGLSDIKRRKIMRLYNHLDKIFDPATKNEDFKISRQILIDEKILEDNTEIKKQNIQQLENLFMKLFNADSKQFVK